MKHKQTTVLSFMKKPNNQNAALEMAEWTLWVVSWKTHKQINNQLYCISVLIPICIIPMISCLKRIKIVDNWQLCFNLFLSRSSCKNVSRLSLLYIYNMLYWSWLKKKIPLHSTINTVCCVNANVSNKSWWQLGTRKWRSQYIYFQKLAYSLVFSTCLLWYY